ncbi:MAG TPA: nitrogen regulation protein NR(II) [Gammaproteobacteria bacterium]|jgi:two-component system nitrogen regulation sensor histidine kinase GlnL|nr:nitrogen regulation protein NR(II) [Gammaproteobacteria bacterium]
MAVSAPGLSLQTILENQTTAVLWLDGELRLSYLNPAAETLLKLDARQVLGGPIEACLPEASEFAQALHRAAETRETFTQRELKLPLAERDSITVDCTATPVAESEGETPLLVELAPLDRHLRISRDDAFIAQHAANRVLARNLAHEIRNPLGGLRGAAQLLERRLPDPALKEYTGVILREADRLTALVDAMLGPMRPSQLVRSNIHELLEHVRQLLAAEAPAQVKLLRDYDPSLPELELDRDQMIQALLNIARNACEALIGCGRGSITFRSRVLRQFTIGQKRHRLAACVDIADDGPGIPAELQPRIFAPLVSGKPGGTGLGLSIAQELINRHGGLIECVSAPGSTIFSVILPLEEQP